MRQRRIGTVVAILCGMIVSTGRGQTSAPAFAGATGVPASAAGGSHLTIDPAFLGMGNELLLFQDMPVVISASRSGKSEKEVPSSVSIITARDIELFGYRSLAEVLRNQRGFYLTTDGFNWFAGERGFLRPGEWNARMMVLVDGRPTRETTYGQTSLEQDFIIPMEAVERVEVVRAPGSGLYGGNAVFSVTNLVTKSGSDINGVQLKLSGGTQETGRFSALFGKNFEGDWDVLAGVTGFTSAGDTTIHYDGVNDAAHNFGFVRNADAEKIGSAFVKITHGELTLAADFATRNKDNRTVRYQPTWTEPGFMQEERANLTAKWDHAVAEGQSFHAMAYYGHYRYHDGTRYNDDGTYWYYSDAESDWIGGEMHYDWQVSEQVHLLAGADGTQGLSNQQHDRDGVSGEILNVDPAFNAWGLFAQVDYKPADWISFTAGIRLNDTAHVGFDVAPNAAVIITPTQQDTFKLLYGRAFRTPNLYEMYYAVSDYNTPNLALKSEACDTYEILWERQDESGWKTTVGPYLWVMSHTLEDVTLEDGSAQTQNRGSRRAYGFEAEIQKKWESGARVRAYGTVTRAEDHGETLAQSPAWIVGAAVAFPVINDRTFLAIEPQIVGPQKNDVGEYTNPTFITNVVLTSRNVWKGVDLQAGVYNIFGELARLPRFSEADHFQQTLNWPRTQLMLSVTGRF